MAGTVVISIGIIGMGIVFAPNLWWSLPLLAAVPWLRFAPEAAERARIRRAVAHGGIRVQRLLEPLSQDGFEVVNDVAGVTGSIDHVVVGPTGIYAVQTAAWRGAVVLERGGKIVRRAMSQEHAVQRAVDASADVARRLSGTDFESRVVTVIALTQASTPRGPILRERLAILPAGQVAGYIRGSRRARLDHTEIARVTAALLRTEAPVVVEPAGLQLSRRDPVQP